MKPKRALSRTNSAQFSHLSAEGQARMADIGKKPIQKRQAIAEGRLVCQPATIDALRRQALPKGDVLAVAKVAGIQAAKRCADLVPLCHTLLLSHIEVMFQVEEDHIRVFCLAETSAQTGVEMEALTGVSIAALTLYDMCKAVDKTMHIENVRVVRKIKE